ncbi:MAG: hypothetical protein ACPGSD_17615 [Flavobacteriales bacterium]|jgi:hypothetical protein
MAAKRPSYLHHLFMLIDLKLSKLSVSDSEILLFKEGHFLRVYNIHLCWFVETIKRLKIHVRFIKKVKQTIYYGGFPKTIMDDLITQLKSKGLQVIESEEYFTIINVKLPEVTYYNHWKLDVDNKLKDKAGRLDIEKKYDDPLKLLKEIESYPIGRRTPFEAMEFLVDIQSRLRIKDQ